MELTHTQEKRIVTFGWVAAGIGLVLGQLHALSRFETESGSEWDEWLSQGVKLVRKPSARGAWGLVRGALRRILKPGDPAS